MSDTQQTDPLMLLRPNEKISREYDGWSAYSLEVLNITDEIPHFATPMEAVQWLIGKRVKKIDPVCTDVIIEYKKEITVAKVIGKCSNCGGRVTVPSVWFGSIPPKPICESCGATTKEPDDKVIPMNLPPNPLLHR